MPPDERTPDFDEAGSCPFLLGQHSLHPLCVKWACEWWIREKKRCAMNQAARALTVLAGKSVVPRSGPEIADRAGAGDVVGSSHPPQNAAKPPTEDESDSAGGE